MERTTENYISLYNTVGLIERDKNIYFVPHQADIYAKRTAQRTKVCDCYMELFNTVLSFSSRYHDIKISQWTPEDRSLVIEGTIDDFRQSRGRGLALNYLIVKRTVSDEESGDVTSNHYYFAYFIDSVEQRGNNSVRLSLTPDHFTNLYYLNNEDTLTSTYDPFNPIMKNCFVERQHYDRFEKVGNRLRYKNQERILSSEETFKYKYQYKDLYLQMPLGSSFQIDRLKEIYTSLKNINDILGFRNYVTSLSQEDAKLLNKIFTIYGNYLFKEDLLYPVNYLSDVEIDPNTHNNHVVYKVGRPDYKMLSSPITHCVLPFINIPRGLENISKSWFKMEVVVCSSRESNTGLNLGSVNRFFKEPTDVIEYLESHGASQYILTSFVSKDSPINTDLEVQILPAILGDLSVHFVYRIYLNENMPDYSNQSNIDKDQKVDLKSTGFGILAGAREDYPALSIDDLQILDNNFTLSGYLFDFSTSSPTLNSNVFFTAKYDDTNKASNLSTQAGSNYFMRNFMFVLGKTELDTALIGIPDGLSDYDIESDYKEPIVESEPYKFYSISIYETEQILFKSRYFRNYQDYHFNVRLDAFMSFNDSFKVGLIPAYNVDDEYKRYYSESIVIILNTQIPIIEDSWLSYFAVNKAQMKNQYAIQRANYETTYTVRGLKGVSNVITGASSGGEKAGSTGAIVGGANAVVDYLTDFFADKYTNEKQLEIISLTQKAKMSDMGAKPDTVRFAGSDLLYDGLQNDMGFHLNHYRIDEVSYNSICKYLERYGYMVKLFDSLNIFDRVGLNYLKINSFDFVEDNFVLSEEQMNAVSSIFAQGVTLLHDKDFLHNLGDSGYHNIETALKEVI